MKGNSVFNKYFWMWAIVSLVFFYFYPQIPAWYGLIGSFALFFVVLSNFLPRFMKIYTLTFIVSFVASGLSLLLELITNIAYGASIGYMLIGVVVTLIAYIGLAFVRKFKGMR